MKGQHEEWAAHIDAQLYQTSFPEDKSIAFHCIHVIIPQICTLCILYVLKLDPIYSNMPVINVYNWHESFLNYGGVYLFSITVIWS